MALDADKRVPVTVVTGYLGAGKTTLLNHILHGACARRFAIIVNEFGDVGIDADLIESGTEELIELASGCLCCVVRGDLIQTLRGLLKRDPDLDGILIETTGVANPSPIIQTFSADQILAGLTRLDSVVTVVDAVHVAGQVAQSPDAADQVALASILVLNKVSQAADRAACIATLRALNPHATIYPTDRGRISAGQLLDTGSFSLPRVAQDLEDVEALHESGQNHLRTNAQGPDSGPDSGPDCGPGDLRADHSHVAANGITSVAFRENAAIDGAALETWLERLLLLHGADILRLKGVLALANEPRRVIVQSVHMMYEVAYGAPWGDSAPDCRLVIIGRNLHHMDLSGGFASCKSTIPA